MSTFEQTLREYVEQLNDLRQRGASEASITNGFLTFLRKAFPRVEVSEPFLLEEHVPALQVRGGFVDVLYGDLIFEFKRKLDDADRQQGLSELTRYLLNQRNPEQFFGILTDGETVEVYVLRDGNLEKVDQIKLDIDKAEECHLWLDCYLFHEKHLVPTTNDITNRFGERSPAFAQSYKVLKKVWESAKNDPSTQTKFAEWQSLLAIVYGSPVGDEDLFLRHTYLALLARVLAFVALKRKAPDSTEVKGLPSGETFERMGLDNFVSDDFFAWVKGNPDAEAMLRSLATLLTTSYDLSHVNEDLLKELYQELVDPETRHDLGEFYTPDWLAELTLRKAGFLSSDSDASVLDPACGSGTFLFTAVRLVREKGLKGADLVNFVSSRLAGIDVHPLAVTIARTNLVLALGEDLRAYKERLSVPVYMADALNLPDIGSVEVPGESSILVVPVNIKDLAKVSGKSSKDIPDGFRIPIEGGEDAQKRLNDAVDAMFDFASISLSDADAKQGFSACLKEMGIQDTSDWLNNLTLTLWLFKPPATDTVWRFLLKNAYQPALLSLRKFSFVVGNPPWLSYRYVKRHDYQERLRRLVLEKHKLLSSKETHLFTQMELATLFFAFCAEHYLAPDGTLAFVMPRSVLTGAKQHAEFRSHFVATAELLIDCEEVTPLFNVPACSIIWRKKEKQTSQSTVPVVRLKADLQIKNMSWEEAEKVLTERKGSFCVPTPRARSKYYERAKQGASIVPRCLWFVRPYTGALILASDHGYYQTDNRIEKQAKAPWRGIRLGGKVEADFLYATLLSDDLLPFGWRALSLLVLPLHRGRLIDAREAVQIGRPHLAAWLRTAEEKWADCGKVSERVPSPYHRLDYDGNLTKQALAGVYKLLYNTSGTYLCACVVNTDDSQARTVYGLNTQGFVADTKTYWLDTTNPDEAHFLCACLNARSVDEFIKPFQTKGAFGAQRGKGQRHIHRRPFEVLPIPLFDPSDTIHLRLSELSKDCHKKVAKFLETANKKTLAQPIGRLRQEVRELLKSELSEIDELVAQLLQLEDLTKI